MTNINNIFSSYSNFQGAVEFPAAVEKRYESIVELSTKTLQLAGELLNKEFPELQSMGIAVFATGSDARLEKSGIASPLELILVCDNELAANHELFGRIGKFIRQSEFAKLFYPEIEIKCLNNTQGRGLVAEYVGTKKRKIIPTRALDAQRIAGSQQVSFAYKAALLAEVIDKKIKIVKFKRESVDYAKRTLQHDLALPPKSIQREVKPLPKQLDLDSGTLFFNNDTIKGHKFGALRFIQYGVAFVGLRALQNQNINSQEMATFPSTVSDRLEWLKNKKIIQLTDEETKTLQFAYKTSICWYSQLQAKANGKEMVTVQVDPKALKTTLGEIYSLGKKMLKYGS